MIIFLTIINRDSFYPNKELSPNGLKFNGQNSITWIKFKILTFVSEFVTIWFPLVNQFEFETDVTKKVKKYF